MTSSASFLPPPDIAHQYCVAMFMAQQLEADLRYILDSADFYGLIDEIALTEAERRRFGSVVDFLYRAGAGRLVDILRTRISLTEERNWKMLKRAIEDRNLLAHRFLAMHQFSGISKKKSDAITRDLQSRVRRISWGVCITRMMRAPLEAKTNAIEDQLDRLWKELGIEGKRVRKKTRR